MLYLSTKAPSDRGLQARSPDPESVLDVDGFQRLDSLFMANGVSGIPVGASIAFNVKVRVGGESTEPGAEVEAENEHGEILEFWVEMDGKISHMTTLVKDMLDDMFNMAHQKHGSGGKRRKSFSAFFWCPWEWSQDSWFQLAGKKVPGLTWHSDAKWVGEDVYIGNVQGSEYITQWRSTKGGKALKSDRIVPPKGYKLEESMRNRKNQHRALFPNYSDHLRILKYRYGGGISA